MSNLKIKEVYDGRLPEYQVIKENPNKEFELLKIFDTLEGAQNFIEKQLTTSCGEEDPCY